MLPFPQEILLMIFNYMDIESLDSLGQTCRSLYISVKPIKAKRTLTFGTTVDCKYDCRQHRMEFLDDLPPGYQWSKNLYPPFQVALVESGLRMEDIEELRVIVMPESCARSSVRYTISASMHQLVNLKRLYLDCTPAQVGHYYKTRLLTELIPKAFLDAVRSRDINVVFVSGLWKETPLFIRQSSRNFRCFNANLTFFLGRTSDRRKRKLVWYWIQDNLRREKRWDHNPLYTHTLLQPLPIIQPSVNPPQSFTIIHKPRQLISPSKDISSLFSDEPPVPKKRRFANGHFPLRLFHPSPPQPRYNITSLHLEGVRIHNSITYATHWDRVVEAPDACPTTSNLVMLLISQRASLKTLILRNCWLGLEYDLSQAQIERWEETLGMVALVGMEVLNVCKLDELYDELYVEEGVPRLILDQLEEDLSGYGKFGGRIGEYAEHGGGIKVKKLSVIERVKKAIRDHEEDVRERVSERWRTTNEIESRYTSVR